jgi:para-nitrobenzyl esterase
VVVVSLNHRLSAFGFMHLRELGGEAYADSGNVGMLDIMLALRWVRDNIAQLGGDPSNVTIFGESGGGAKVSVLMAMPAARGLFSRAIVQSGSHLHGWTPEQATANARTLLHALELGDNDVAKLRELPVKAILRALAKVSPLPGGRVAFSPVIDGVSLRRAPWQPDAPVESTHVPLLVGSTATETTLLLGASTPELFSLSEDGLRERLRYWLRGAEPEPIIAAFRATTPAASPSDLFFAITTALRVRRQLWEQADLKLRQGGAPVWVYELAWETPLEGGKWRSPHALDVSLVFDNAAASAMTRDSAAADGVAAQMADSWIAFARSGDPNHPGIPAWPQHSDDGGHVMLFDAPSRVQAHWRAQERAALAGLPIHQVNR